MSTETVAKKWGYIPYPKPETVEEKVKEPVRRPERQPVRQPVLQPQPVW